MRRIVVRDKEKNEKIVLLTNHFGFGATTIASIYKDRWEIELFFKALKQNLKVKTFIGTSENALRIQIWTALVSMLVLKWLHHLSRAPWSFSNMATMLRLNLFTYRDLRAWLDEPYETPPVVPRPEQLNLNMQCPGQTVSFSRNSRLGDLVSNPSKSGFQTVANTGGRFRFRAILESSDISSTTVQSFSV